MITFSSILLESGGTLFLESSDSLLLELPGEETLYNFGAFVDRRNIPWPEWDPSGVQPHMTRN